MRPPEPYWSWRDRHPHLSGLTVMLLLVVVLVTSVLAFVMWLTAVRDDANQTPTTTTLPLPFPTTSTSTTTTVPTG